MKIYKWSVRYFYSGQMEYSFSSGFNSTKEKAKKSLEGELSRLKMQSANISRDSIEEIEVD